MALLTTIYFSLALSPSEFSLLGSSIRGSKRIIIQFMNIFIKVLRCFNESLFVVMLKNEEHLLGGE